MKTTITFLTLLFLSLFFCPVFAWQNQEPPALNEKLRQKDSVFFDAILSTHDTKKMADMLASDFEYYADNGSPTYSRHQNRSEYILAIEKLGLNKTVKMRRMVAPGTLQVFMIQPNMAIQTGTQQFYMAKSGEKERLVEVSRFTRTWQKERSDWKLAKEFDAMSTQTEGREEPELYDEIVRMDSIYFGTYNTCDLKKMRSLMSDHLEFYHDKGGLDTSVTNVIASIQKNICGKVTRTLVPGSIEVYPIANYGAVEIGYHRFTNKAEGNSTSRPGKFVIIWQKTKDSWIINRVVSLH